MTELLDRAPPQNLEAEQCTLGSMSISGEALERGVGILRAEDFYRETHQTIFEAMRALWERKEPIDIVTIQEELRGKGRLDQVGGTEYLAALIDSVPTSANLEYYAKIVREKAIRRRGIDQCSTLIHRFHSDDRLPEVLGQGYDGLLELAKCGTKQDYRKVSDLLLSAWEQLEDWHSDPRIVTGVPTGITGLDYMTSGYQPEDLWLVAARPGMGKTAYMLQGARADAKAGYPVGIVSKEMPASKLVIRLLSSQARVPKTTMRRGKESEEEWERLARAANCVADMPFFINDSPSFHIRDLPIIVRRMVADGVKIVYIDYIQLLATDVGENRQLEVSELAVVTKQTARENGIPIVALAQLNRAPDARKDKRPVLSDLRESGKLEAEADGVITIFNPEQDGEDDATSDAEFSILKQRDGPKGRVKVKWNGALQEFSQVADRAEDLEGDQLAVWRVISTDKIRPDQIAAETGLGMPAVGAALSILEISKLIRRHAGNQYSLREK